MSAREKTAQYIVVMSEDVYLALDGENVVVLREDETAGRFPLHTLEQIISFSYKGASPALMGACARKEIGLSFAYALLGNDCASALEGVGLDAYVGFLHRNRPGRQSLALDLMEELRGVMADRFVLTLINRKIVKAEHFDRQGDGAVLLNETGRKQFLSAWQQHKKETITHPFLEEKLPWGLVPHVQAMLLARTIRGDLEGYPPFLWK